MVKWASDQRRWERQEASGWEWVFPGLRLRHPELSGSHGEWEQEVLGRRTWGDAGSGRRRGRFLREPTCCL